MSTNVREKILSTIRGVDDVPCPPPILQQIRSEIANSQVSSNALSKLIASDPALDNQIHRLLASPVFAHEMAFAREGNIQLAIAHFGVEAFEHLAISACLLRLYQDAPMPKSFNIREFWRHSLSVGIAAKVILNFAIKVSSQVNRHDAFLAGLCHDLGRLILAARFDGAHLDVREYVQQESALQIDAERQLLEIGHDEIGACFGEKWEIAPIILSAVRWHHESSACPERTHRSLAQTIEMANFVCNHQGLGDSGNAAIPSLPQDVFAALGLSSSSIPDIIEEVQSRVQGVNAILGA